MTYVSSVGPGPLARRLLALVCVVLAWTSGVPVFAQTTRDAALRVTVADQTGAIIVNAKVTIQPVEPAGPAVEAVTDERGEALVGTLAPGRYSVRAEFPGFEPRQLDDLRLRAGSSTRREMKLNLGSIRAGTRSGTC
jgi:Carboxypeptidase regulatory-like domain